ncbi:hypothetical protein LshimejAT787_2001270 [Lyophyllum shimeji]|uniref:Pentatricopeptide repeat domain-containing protein n=1 Tax=Lyophyllum shimeji TaxID=47721 RepID=A0A9P3UUJ5_LYOSH|nr:hypothetical protein LshimejAT787_2001270 [Lyophyllum shimeji]
MTSTTRSWRCGQLGLIDWLCRHDMKVNGLCRAQSRISHLAACSRPPGLRGGLRVTFNAAKRHNLCASEHHTIRTLHHGWTVGARRSSSESAIKHLVSGTSTTLWLYEDPSQAFSRVEESPEVSNATLVGLVKDGKMGAADRLRLQLIERGIEIQPHAIYEQAAIANLRWADMEHCMEQFTTWFTLVPDYDPSKPPTPYGPFKDTRDVLIHSGWPSARLPLILRFGIISASKGYLRPILHDILPFIRFASPDGGARWLYEMEQAAVEYQSTHRPREAEETARRYRALTVDLCSQECWLDHALAIVRLERSFALPDRSYTLLIRALRNAGRLDDVKEVERHLMHDALRDPLPNSPELKLTSPSRVPHHPSKSAVETPVDHKSELSPPTSHTVGTCPTSDVTEDILKDVQQRTISRKSLSKQLRAFKYMLGKGTCPHHLRLIPFLSDFKTVGGSPRVITWLRHRALSRREPCGMAWINAELRYQNAERNYDEILKLYLTYLDTRLPLPSVFWYTLNRIAAENRFTIVPSLLPKYRLRDRWLILKSIIHLALRLPWPLATLQALYTSYRRAIARWPPPNRESNEILSTFIAVFGECGSPHDATRVLADTGSTPYLRQVETLALVLARAGKVDEAMALLRRIEVGADDRRKGMLVKGYDGKVDVAVPRITTYGRMIEGFVAAGLLEPALELERRMKARFKYEYGGGKKLDGAMKRLWALEMERAQQPKYPSVYR